MNVVLVQDKENSEQKAQTQASYLLCVGSFVSFILVFLHSVNHVIMVPFGGVHHEYLLEIECLKDMFF